MALHRACGKTLHVDQRATVRKMSRVNPRLLLCTPSTPYGRCAGLTKMKIAGGARLALRRFPTTCKSKQGKPCTPTPLNRTPKRDGVLGISWAGFVIPPQTFCVWFAAPDMTRNVADGIKYPVRRWLNSGGSHRSATGYSPRRNVCNPAPNVLCMVRRA